ncbi:hypothetical protein WMY93_020714 [Mugilogobius chulae]|uniref:SH3 domain-containing protein n=1 Tax=Mugilogobius chulae TaxID=88201 RepID=A0AAW0NJT0_9GOBI
MALKARVLYDFHSENPGEISIYESELVTLFSEEELEGWLEGENSRGETGLLPASYVEIVREQITSAKSNNGLSSPKPAAGQSQFASPASQRAGGGGLGGGSGSGSCGGSSFHTSQGSDDDWDDDWDEPSPATANPPGSYSSHSSPPLYPVTTSLPATSRRSSTQQQVKSSGTVGRNLNRFTTFVKSGGEAFLLGEASALVRDVDRICVVMGKHGPEWQQDPLPFTCSIDDPPNRPSLKA